MSGASLASELGISLRTLYRDVAALQAQGAQIEGEPGLGYVLKPGFLLPPLMFTEDEIEALVLGSRWVAKQGDARLGAAASQALQKIAAVLPAELRESLDGTGLFVGPTPPEPPDAATVAVVRQAIRAERKLALTYSDHHGKETRRVIWPFALGYFERTRVVAAWCERRQDYRHFRTDRILALTLEAERYPRRKQALLREWREREHILPQ